MNRLRFSKEREIGLFVLCIWLFLIRIALPFIKYLFVPYFLCFLAYTIINVLKDRDQKKFLGDYVRFFSAFLLICLFFLIGVLFSSKLDFYFLKEGLAMFVLICLGIMAFIYIGDEDAVKSFYRIFMKQLIIFCCIICFFSLVKLFFFLRDVKFAVLSDSFGLYPSGTSLVLDYNFYSLVNIIGIITACFILIKERSGKRSVLLQLLIFGLVFNVVFSTSRRGIIVLTLVILILFLIFLFGWMAKKGTWMAVLSVKLRFVFIFLFGFIFLLIIFLSQRPFHSRSSVYASLGFDRDSGKELVFMCARRYFTIIEPQFKSVSVDQYFDKFMKTGEIGGLNRIFEFNRNVKGLYPNDSLRLIKRKGQEGKVYLSEVLNDPENRFSGNRVQRINFAFQIFSEQYSTLKKIIGGGFDYLWDYGYKFYQGNGKRFMYDYPHNPVLSALLYSGILGGLSLVYFFCMTILNFIRGFRDLIYFICVYIIMFFFAFFSGNSIFGNPEFVFVSLVPFYFAVIRYKRNQKNLVTSDD